MTVPNPTPNSARDDALDDGATSERVGQTEPTSGEEIRTVVQTRYIDSKGREHRTPPYGAYTAERRTVTTITTPWTPVSEETP